MLKVKVPVLKKHKSFLFRSSCCTDSWALSPSSSTCASESSSPSLSDCSSSNTAASMSSSSRAERLEVAAIQAGSKSSLESSFVSLKVLIKLCNESVRLLMPCKICSGEKELSEPVPALHVVIRCLKRGNTLSTKSDSFGTDKGLFFACSCTADESFVSGRRHTNSQKCTCARMLRKWSGNTRERCSLAKHASEFSRNMH